MTAENLLIALREAVDGLLFMSESEAVIDVQHLCALDALPLTDADTYTLDDVLEQPCTERDWHSEAEKADVLRYRHLKTLIEDAGCSITVYKTQPPVADIYIVLETEGEGYIVLHTQVVET